MRETIEDMKDDIPDEEMVQKTKHYVGDKQIFKAYNTHAMRSKDAIDEMAKIEIYQTTFVQRFLLLARAVLPFVARKTPTTAVQPTKEAKLSVEHLDIFESRIPINRKR